MTNVRVIESKSDLIAAQRLRYRVLCDHLGWLPKNQFFLEQDEWDNQSTHIVASRGQEVIGTIRLIHPKPLMLPMEKCWELPPQVKGTTHTEISRLVVHPDNRYSPHSVSTALIGAAIKTTKRLAIECLVVALDQFVWRLLRSMGIVFEQIGEPKHYLGSLTIPGMRSYQDLQREVSETDQTLFRVLFDPEPILSIEEVEERMRGQGK